MVEIELGEEVGEQVSKEHADDDHLLLPSSIGSAFAGRLEDRQDEEHEVATTRQERKAVGRFCGDKTVAMSRELGKERRAAALDEQLGQFSRRPGLPG